MIFPVFLGSFMLDGVYTLLSCGFTSPSSLVVVVVHVWVLLLLAIITGPWSFSMFSVDKVEGIVEDDVVVV